MGWRAFFAIFIPSFVVVASWSLAMPRDTGPDEPSHVVHAAGVVRGELTGAAIPHFDGWVQVRVPAPYALGIEQDRCYQFSPLVPASCEPTWPTSRATTNGLSYTGRYPPTYYAIVGIPSLVTSSVEGFYAMRLVSALLAAAFLGLAGLVITTWSRNRRWLSCGMLIAATPMAVYSAAVVNPSGLEIAAALCLWIAGLVLVREHRASPPRGLLAIVALCAAALCAARAISPLWLLVIGATLATLCGVRRIVALLRIDRFAQVCIAFVGCVVGASLVWTLREHAFEVQKGLVTLGSHPTALDVVRTAFKREGTWTEEIVGIFGSHEVLAPLVTYVTWWVVGGAVTLVALLRGARREVAALVGIVACCVVAPVLLQLVHARDLGIVWQGRYMLPVAVGVPILGAVVTGTLPSEGRARRRFLAAAFVAIPAASFLAFAEALRRYAVGVDGPIAYAHPAWQPPGGVVCWLCVNLAATSWFAWVLWQTGRPAAIDRTAVPDVLHDQTNHSVGRSTG